MSPWTAMPSSEEIEEEREYVGVDGEAEALEQKTFIESIARVSSLFRVARIRKESPTMVYCLWNEMSDICRE
uniref:Uncharacterized protein n=1 Tax=Arundo donax TaxID=35708 RepID=A0A0A9FAP0_ARUDO